MNITVAGDADARRWDAFVAAEPTSTSYHEWAWGQLFARVFKHRVHNLMAIEPGSGGIAGVLPLVEIRSALFGRTLTSMPFVNYGGIASSSDAAADALVDAATRLARERGCRHVELRHVNRRFARLPCRQHKVAMRLSIAPGLWDRLDRKVRNQVRKAQKSELTVERGGMALVGAFYEVFARNMRDLGTPVYTRRLFEEVLQTFPDRAHLIVVRLKGAPIAAGLTYRSGGTVEMPWASSIRDYNNLCPNHLLYWHAIENAIEQQCDRFDFGRSTPGEGTFKFKEQWGAVPTPLHWEYSLLQGDRVPDQGPTNPKYRLAISLWQRCPLWLAKVIGPPIVRSIP